LLFLPRRSFIHLFLFTYPSYLPSLSTTGSKYVPPHLRNSGGNSGRNNNSNSNDGSSNGGRGGGGGYKGNDTRGSYSNDRNGGSDRRGPPQGGGERGGPPVPQANSRWSNVEGPSGGGGGYQGGGGGRGGGNYGQRANERGFHGDMKADHRLEQRLFHATEQQTTGINFDNYDKIPIEVSGENIPDPIDSYSEATIGVDLYRNTQLCGYDKPTPVQKYSIPIATAGRDGMFMSCDVMMCVYC
jgi:ATP-dependent RNA helicase DDX3X